MRQTVHTGLVSAPPTYSTRCPLAMNGMLAGRYRIQSVLGEGGMATVYSAWDESLGRMVAVKACQTTIYGQVSEDEAQLQASCQHPNLMPLYDAGTDPLLNASYIVMPLYPGADLRQTINRVGPLPFRTALLCVDQICSALDFLMLRRQAIHGDIKPANIWITNSGAALLMDFNLYGLLARGRTLRGGTPGFMPPEAMAGNRDTRSDVFALGCVLYACLTGELPFSDDAAVLKGTYTPIERLRPEIYPELVTVVQRALEIDVTKRYQSVREFQNDLRRPLQAIQNQRLLPFLLRSVWRGTRALVSQAYRSLWWLIRRQFRLALRRPVQALIETVVACVTARIVFQILVAWVQTHALVAVIGSCVALLVIMGVLSMIWKFRRRRRLGGRG